MADLLGDIVAWMEGLAPTWVYVTVFAVAYLENVIPPIPGDMVVVFGGYLVGLGTVELVPVIVLATVAGALGFMTMFAIGRWVGEAALDPERLRWVPKRGARLAQRWLRRYGLGVVAANRFLSGARSVISLMAGAAEMRPVPVALWATVSAAVWCSLIAYAGFAVGDNWGVVGHYLALYGRWAMGLLVAGFAGWFGFRAWQRRGERRSGEEPEIEGFGDSRR